MVDRFPNIDEAKNWYLVTLDGIRYLKRLVDGAKPQDVSDGTLDQIMFMTEAEWKDFVRRKEDEHEAFASLALLAACEGGIRRDCQWRGEQGNYPKFTKLTRRKNHVSLANIIDTWQGAVVGNRFFEKHLNVLRELYMDRNSLAHGRASLKQFNFFLIYDRLDTVRAKWRQTASDFKGF